MRIVFVIIWTLLLLSSLTLSEEDVAAEKPKKEEVITLEGSNFTDFFADKDIALVEFYAPWCGHCKNLAPELESAALTLKSREKPIYIAKVDATVEGNKELAKDYNVNGFPTMKVLRYGKNPSDYHGGRVAKEIVDYMIEQSLPAARQLNSVADVKRFMSKEDVTVLGFFASDQSKMQQHFKDAADALREEYKSVGYVEDEEVASKFKAKTDYIGIYYPEKMWSKYEPKYRFFQKPTASQEDIEAFIRSNTVCMADHRTTQNKDRRFMKFPLVVAYFTVDWSLQHRDGTQFWRQKVLKVANEYKEHYRFAISDEEEFSRELADVGLGDSAQDVSVVVFGKNGQKYPWTADVLDEDFAEDSFSEFMEMIQKGKVKPHIKSQPVPKGDKGPVYTIVGSNFDRIVNDESQDVLIEFYAPWCGHCKNFEPAYKKMAEKLAKTEKNLKLTKMDATTNDPPGNYKVEGFPTIYFAPKGSKETPIKYSGNRDENDLLSFMKKHAVLSFQQKDEL